MKAASRPVWGKAPAGLAMVDAAAREGVSVMGDWYPYRYWHSSMYVLIPDRDVENRAKWQLGLDEVGGASHVLISSYKARRLARRQDAGANRPGAWHRSHSTHRGHDPRRWPRHRCDCYGDGRRRPARDSRAPADDHLFRRHDDGTSSSGLRRVSTRARSLRARGTRDIARGGARQDDQPFRARRSDCTIAASSRPARKPTSWSSIPRRLAIGARRRIRRVRRLASRTSWSTASSCSTEVRSQAPGPVSRCAGRTPAILPGVRRATDRMVRDSVLSCLG